VAPARRVLYSWTTAEQVAELREGGVLLTRTERPGLGAGYAFTSIANLAAATNGSTSALLSGLLTAFAKARYAWPNAWATRVGWPGEDYGDQLLRIVLRPDAWIVIVYDGGGVAVVDMENQPVSMEDAAATPGRVGAVYFYKQDAQGRGTFGSLYCTGGYREFIVGNEAMIEEWSLGTASIKNQIEADAELIEDLLRVVRPSPPTYDAATFNTAVACSWDSPVSGDLDRYERSLAIPSENYIPLPAGLANLASALRASLFEPDPFVVKPGE
jgi:hypothetical protein